MVNSRKIKLPEQFVNFLLAQPEQGMGYQIVDIKLKSEIWLESKIVVNSEYLQLNENENINPQDIVKMRIHQS